MKFLGIGHSKISISSSISVVFCFYAISFRLYAMTVTCSNIAVVGTTLT